MDRSWIHLSFLDKLFISGVKDFVEFTKLHHRNKAFIPCPCGKCQNKGKAKPHDEVTEHCFRNGFDSTYKVWCVHGEKPVEDQTVNTSNIHENEYEMNMNDVFNTVAENYSPNNLDTLLERGQEEVEAIEDINFTKNLREAMGELYDGSTEFSVLRFIVKLFNLKITHGWTDNSFTELLQLLKVAFPPSNKLPENTYRGEKIITDLGLNYEKIHACPNDCILYWDENKYESKCPTCGVSRYQNSGIEQFKKRARVPAKVFRYFPIANRLKRLYSVDWVAKAMRWHFTRKSKPGKMTHPTDSGVWKTVDSIFPDFAAEPRNVRLALATDGFNPFSSLSTSYSSWPLMCVTYNLPPWLCMKPQFTMLTGLIEGPRQPGNDIDVYLQPLVKELYDVWEYGVIVKDAFKDEMFNMRAILLWTIHDFPAFGNVSGCKTKGKFGCPPCGPKTAALRLHYGSKDVYMRHRRWLPLLDEARKDVRESTFDKTVEKEEQPERLTGIEVDSITKNIRTQWGKGKRIRQDVEEFDDEEGQKVNLYFSKRSIFFSLPYWKHIQVRHNLDVMHIEKNVCEILIAMMLNTKGKTKDHINARKDLKRLKIKKKYWISEVNGKEKMRPGIFWLQKDEKKYFLQTLGNLRVAVGFGGNWSRIVKGDSVDLKGMKSHDYHILMQHLLPVLIQHAYRDNERKPARSILVSICTFFNALCSRTIDIETLNALEKSMVRTLCALEKYCPPSLFVIMMHLPIHLAYEARLCGPVFFRWMYPFERMMKTYKGYVANKARPEGCIAERYLKEETLRYCSGYKGGVGIQEKLDRMGENTSPTLPDLFDNVSGDSMVDEAGPVGSNQDYSLEGVEYEQARHWVLKSHPSYPNWYTSYTKYRDNNSSSTRRRTGQSRIPVLEEFIPWLKNQCEFIESNDVDFKDLVRGPTRAATKYNKYCLNGFLFVTKDYQESKKNQNSGVSTSCPTTFRSSAKDKNPIDGDAEYYGVLRKIIQLNYRSGYKPILFKCDWVKCTQHGVRIDIEANLKLVNLSNLLSSDRMGDEPFILAEHAFQVFYSKDPKAPEWHVVLEVPKKVYSDDDETRLLSDGVSPNDINMGINNLNIRLDEELVFNDPNEFFEVGESSRRRKKSRRQ